MLLPLLLQPVATDVVATSSVATVLLNLLKWHQQMLVLLALWC
jgi:hypothetical protein